MLELISPYCLVACTLIHVSRKKKKKCFSQIDEKFIGHDSVGELQKQIDLSWTLFFKFKFWFALVQISCSSAFSGFPFSAEFRSNFLFSDFFSIFSSKLNFFLKLNDFWLWKFILEIIFCFSYESEDLSSFNTVLKKKKIQNYCFSGFFSFSYKNVFIIFWINLFSKRIVYSEYQKFTTMTLPLLSPRNFQNWITDVLSNPKNHIVHEWK